MGYTKKWIPPVKPLSDDLPAWKALFNDLHDNLLLAGLVQTDTPGQLVIDDVSVLPVDGSYAGFIEYAFDDDLQSTAPVVIKLEYGCGAEGLHDQRNNLRGRTPRIRCTVFFSGMSGSVFGCPQGAISEAVANGRAEPLSFGTSYLCHSKEAGFLGVIYGAGSRNKPFSGTFGQYYGSTFSLFVQRTADPDGTPNAQGACLYFNGLDVTFSTPNNWSDSSLPAAYSQYIHSDGSSSPPRRDLALVLGGTSYPSIECEVQTQQVYYQAPRLAPFNWIVSYYTSVAGAPIIPEGNEFEIEVFPGTPSNFIALGNETSFSVDPLVGPSYGIAMLFE